MAFFTGWLAKLIGGDSSATMPGDHVKPRAMMMRTAADALDMLTSNGSGAANVNVIGGTLTAVMDVSTLATGTKQDIANASLAKIAPTSTLLPATVAAKADSGVLKNTACSLYKVIAANSHATTTVYLQLFDSATVPADATAPRIPSIPIAPGKAIVIDLGATPLACANGLSWASSSTVDAKTATAITPLQVSAVLA